MSITDNQPERQVEEIESLCMNCHENGTTRLLLTQIPFFRELVLMSFDCPHCHFKNTEIQSAGEIQMRGVRLTLRADRAQDLQRQIVKSDTAVVRVEDIDLEIPAGRGQLTNLEGLVSMVKGDLEAGQASRREVSVELFEKVDAVIQSLADIAGGSRLPFTLSVDDPAGNSSIEPSPEDRGGKYTRAEYPRTPAQNEALGLSADAGADEAATQSTDAPPPSMRPEYSAAAAMYPAPPPSWGQGQTVNNVDDDEDIVENRVYSIPTPCPGCTRPIHTHMKMVRIPFFSEVVVMSVACEACGYRSNEVKSGGAVPDKGRRITLRLERPEDLSRDILKSESCALECPELQLSVEPGTLGGRFTTVEGLVTQVRDDLRSSVFSADGRQSGSGAGAAGATTEVMPFPAMAGGDSMAGDERTKWDAFFGALDGAVAGEKFPFTIIMTDPLAASYVQSFKAPEPDAQIMVEDYERTEQEKDDLGLNDMKTEGYEGEPDQTAAGADGESKEEKEPIDVEEIQHAVQEQLKRID